MIACIGLLYIVLSWLAGWYLLTKWRNKDFLSISRHAATSLQTRLLFAVVLVGLGAVFYGWLGFWLAPRLGLDIAFRILIGITFVLQAVTGLVPDIQGWKRTVHKLAAWSMALMFLLIGWALSLASNQTKVSQLVCLVLASYMVAGVLAVLSRRYKAHFLWLQASYVLALELIVLVSAYLR